VSLTTLAGRSSKNDATVLPSAAHMQAKRIEAGGDEVCAWGAWTDVEDH